MKYNLECATWELTLKCNLRCFHCEFSAGEALSNELTTKEALNFCEDLSKLGCKRIILMGGEPFLRDDWELISKKIKDLDIDLGYVTNGYINSKKIFSKLKSLEPDFIGVSIDGGKAETHDKIRGVKGSFNRALNFIDKCLEFKDEIYVITSVHKLNISELSILKDLLYDKNICWRLQLTDVAGRFSKKYLLSKDEFYSIGKFISETQKNHPRGAKFINGGHDMGYFSNELPNLTDIPNWNGCLAGINLIAVESDGGIKGCSALTSEFVEANIREKNIIEIWNNPDSFKYNRKFKLKDLKGFCKTCRFNKKCKGGCIETSFMATGKLHSDPYCFHSIESQK